MKIQASAEDYLEAILVLTQKNGKVRSVDIANHMNYAKPTISIIMKQFRDNDYVTFDSDRNIHLTSKGEEIAKRIHERHKLLSAFLMAIGVSQDVAYADACKIEHVISEESLCCIKNFYNKL